MTRDDMDALIIIAESQSIPADIRKRAHDKIVASVDRWLDEQERRRQRPSLWARIVGWRS